MPTLRKSFSPLALVALLLITSLSPLAFAEQGRSTPDFIVSSFELDDAGSISSGGIVQAEDATHIVRIQVQNIGLGAGQASLALLLQGTSSSGDVVLDSTDLGVIAAGASSSVVVFSWTATLGNNQILKARVSSPTDVNTGNNEEQILADVTQYQESSVPVVNIPQPAPGGANVVWSKTVHDFNIGVLNSGVKNQSAQFWLNFTEVANPGNTFSAASNIVPIVRPGAICNSCAATPESVSMSFDATTRTGEWNVVGTMFASGLGWTKDVVFLTQTVVFSDYDFTLTAAHDRSVEPGQTSLLNFIIKNVGIASDDYTVTQSDASGWVSSVTPGSQTPSISPGVTTSVVVGVDVPANALRSASETVTLTIESNNGAFQKTVSTTVLAGELYEGTVVMDPATQSLTPGQTSTLQVEVQNTGNTATTFLISAGISTNPLNWDISLSSPTTGILDPSQSVTVSISVTPPVIKNPLVLAEYNRAGDAMSVWAQATSIHGGIPSLGATPVTILPVIVVDPGLPTTSIDMTVEQVMQAQQGMGLEEILDLDLEVRHNLVTELSETVDATLTLGAAVFVSDSSGGFNEPNRWAIGLSPTAFPDLSLGQSAQAVMTLQGPADDYPVSGTLSIPVTATPTLGTVHQSSGVTPSAITQNLTINIPPVLGAVGHNGSVLDAMVGEETTYAVGLSNTGNNMTSYRLVMTDSLPAGWVASFSSTSLMPTTTVLSVPADVADHPSNSEDHIKNFSLVITTAPMAPANSIESLTIEVQELSSGAYISSFDVPIRVGEKVSASLSPTSQEVNMSIGDDITTSVVISNDGNTPATFGVWLDTSLAGEVDYVLETPTVITVGAGYESTVRVRLNPTSDALAATEYKATVWVSNVESGLNLSSDILGNISEQHGIMVETENEEYGVVPG
ncbi:MAG: hypothetical protein QF531_00925, partial [Candidatus Poseidonia sp.]|nr:hypothetical protein [Poseidonia sp.]